MLRISLRVLAIGLLLTTIIYLSMIQQMALDAAPDVGYSFVYDGIGIITAMIVIVIGVLVWSWFSE